MDRLCEFGCGQKANFFSKSGKKWRCCYAVNSCLGMKEFKKKRILEKYGVEHTSQLQQVKDKNKKTKLERYGDEHYNNREKHIQTTLERYGVENASSSRVIKERRTQTVLARYSVDHISKNPDFIEKKRQNNLEKYGIKCASQTEEGKMKRKQTTIERYGFDNATKNKKIREKISVNLKKAFIERGDEIIEKRQTTIKDRYNSHCPLGNPNILKKKEDTCLVKYGYTNAFKNKEVQQRQQDTIERLFGYRNPAQVPELIERRETSGFKYKAHILSSGEMIRLQGYEGKVLDDLIKSGLTIDQIKYRKSEVPEIWYYSKDRKHRYYPDIYIPHLNWIIEVKSMYTFKRYKEKNLIKMNAVKSLGYRFNFMIR